MGIPTPPNPKRKIIPSIIASMIMATALCQAGRIKRDEDLIVKFVPTLA
jgi:hypothetical protein